MGRPFTDFIAIPEDVQRFTFMAKNSKNAPGLISVTLLQNAGRQTLDAQLFIVRTHQGFILGIAGIKEQLPAMSDMHGFVPQAQCLGQASADAQSVGDGSQSLAEPAETSVASSSIPTAQVFKEVDIRKIHEIGRHEHWLVHTSEVSIDFTTVLGEGGFGILHSGSFCGSPVAVKVAKDAVSHTSTEIDAKLASVVNELRIFRFLRHPNIVLFHGASLANGRVALVLENVKGQLLTHFVLQDMPMWWRESIILELLSVIWYMHSQDPPVVHGDIKSSNMMVEVRVAGVGNVLKPHLKVIDFGLSRVLGSQPQTLGGSRGWRAPELHQQGIMATTSADMFSAGCAMFFILTKQMPFLETNLSVGQWTWPPGRVSTRHGPVCKQCMCPVAEMRPSAVQAHALFNQCLMTSE